MKKNDDRSVVQKQDEEITNKILFVFSLTLLLLLAVIIINRYMNSTAYFNTLTFCTIAIIVFSVVGVGFLAAAFIKRKAKAAQLDKRLLLSGVIALIVAVVLLFVRLYTFRSFTILYFALPVFAFLYMIFNIYQRDFFYQSIVIGCTAGTLYAFSRWLHYRPWQPIVHITYSLAILLLVAAILLAFYLKKQKGMLGKIRMLSHSANYKLMISTFAVMLLAIVVVLIVGSGIAFWTMVCVLGYLFVLAVYYTIRLM